MRRAASTVASVRTPARAGARWATMHTDAGTAETPKRLLIVAAMCTNLSGLALTNFWAGLVCLGVGWNFMYVGGSTLLTQAYRPGERAKVQALNEFLVFATVTTASLSSGVLYSAFGWDMVNAALAIPLLLVLTTLCRSIVLRKMTTRLAAN